MSEQNTLYKLIVLHMLDRIDFSLTSSQISDFILGAGYTTWFTLQASLSELVESGLVHVETLQNNTFYTITEEGEKTIGFFRNKISASIRGDIENYLTENKISLRQEFSVLADYQRTNTGEYTATLRIREKTGDLVALTMTVPDENQAKNICNNWRNKNQEVYEYLVRNLMI